MVIEMNMVKPNGFHFNVIIREVLEEESKFLVKYSIPEAVVGGLLFAIFTLIMKQTGIAEFTFDKTLESYFMNVFYC